MHSHSNTQMHSHSHSAVATAVLLHLRLLLLLLRLLLPSSALGVCPKDGANSQIERNSNTLYLRQQHTPTLLLLSLVFMTFHLVGDWRNARTGRHLREHLSTAPLFRLHR